MLIPFPDQPPSWHSPGKLCVQEIDPPPPQDAISTDSKRTIQEIVIRPGSGLPRQGRQVQINS